MALALRAGPEQITEDHAKQRSEHATAFLRRTGMTPDQCFRVVLLCMSLRILAGGWSSMVILEYTRYYIVNDLNVIAAIEASTGSLQCLLKAFLFPAWGVFADTRSRKQIIFAACIASSLSVWLLVFVPSITVLLAIRLLSLVGDVGSTIRDAMLRDLFCDLDWEAFDGGVTGIKSRMALIAGFVTGWMVIIGMTVFKVGEHYFNLPNEYTYRREECTGKMHCVEPGQFSWGGGWRVDGSLRFLLLVSAVSYTLEAFIVMIMLPETLSPERRRKEKSCHFLQKSCRPWNNLRVFATPQLRDLLRIRFVHYVIAGGGHAIFMSWYRRNQLDTFTIYSIGMPAGIMACFVVLAVPRIVDRTGDLRGVWVPATIFGIAWGLAIAILPASHWYLSYTILPVFGGVAGGLGGFAQELLAKLIPGDVQGTFQTGKSFVYNLQRAILVWPWLGLLVCSEDLPYPFDMLPVWAALAFAALALFLTILQLSQDPHVAILEGRALEAFWETSYAKGPWFKLHGGSHVPTSKASSKEYYETNQPSSKDSIIADGTVVAI
jgi:MFS family permease